MSRVIVDSRNSKKDYYLPTTEARRLYQEGRLAIDLTNSKSNNVIYTEPTVCNTRIAR